MFKVPEFKWSGLRAHVLKPCPAKCLCPSVLRVLLLQAANQAEVYARTPLLLCNIDPRILLSLLHGTPKGLILGNPKF